MSRFRCSVSVPILIVLGKLGSLVLKRGPRSRYLAPTEEKPCA